MRTVVALALLACLSNAAQASSSISLTRDKAMLPDGTALPFVPGSDKLVVYTNSRGEVLNIQHLPANQQRVIVELYDAPLFSHLAVAKHDDRHVLQANPPLSYKQQQVAAESRRHLKKLTEKQHITWSAIHNLDRTASLQRKHTKLLNALIIDIDEQHIDRLKRIPGVKRISRQKLVYKSLVESVPLINTPAVWSMQDKDQLSVSGHGIDVAVLDTGIDYTHPALGGCLGSGCKVVAGYDFHNQDDDPMDGDGHGTHVAGIIAAESDEYSGVAPKVNLHAYKVLSDEGWGNNTDIIAALEYAVDPDGDPTTDDAVDVINMSLGGGGDADDPLSRATNAAVEAGIIVVVAAGNYSGFGDIAASSPAAAEKAITVASTTKFDQLSNFSSKGESVQGAALKPEIAAPGSNIVAPYLKHSTAALDGTSMASPHVAGAAALLRQLYPNASAADIRGMLMAGSVDLGLLPYEQGSGRLNIEAATQVAFYSQQGIVAFGQVGNQTDNWQRTMPLTLHNISNQEQAISLSLSDAFAATMPENVKINWPEHNYVIPAKGSLIIDITIDVTNPQSLAFPENGAFVFTERLVISSAQQSLTVPITLEKANEIVVHMAESGGGNLSLYSDDVTYNRWFNLAAGSSRIIKVPQGSLIAVLNFDWAGQAKFPGVALPEDATVFAYDIKRIDTAVDTEVSFTLSDIDTLLGFDTLFDADGQPLDITDFDHTMSSNGNVYYGDNISTGVFSFGFPRVFIGFSSNSAITHADYSAFGFLPNHTESPNQLRLLSLQKTIDNSSPGIHNLTPHLNELRDITVLLPDYEIAGNKSVYYHNINGTGGGVVDVIKSDASSVVVSVMPELATHNRFSAGFVEQTDIWHDNLITSPLLVPLPEAGVAAGSLRIKQHFAYPSDTVDLRNSGNFFSAAIYSQNNSLKMSDSQHMQNWSVVHDINLNSYGNMPTELELSWHCGQEIVEQVAINPTREDSIAIPELPCVLPALSISFNSWLQGTLYSSWLNAKELNPDNFYFDSINRVSILENNINVTDQIVNRINSRLVIDLAGTADTLRAELQLGSGNFIELSKSTDLSNEMQASFSLPMISGQHIASVRLTYGYNEEYSQTLNGLFVFGADAGDGDVDGDGNLNAGDNDDDNDGVNDSNDAFPLDPAEWLDTDGDGSGNNADADDDNDGVNDSNDAFPLDPAEWLDTDGDGSGNNADADDDNDGVNDSNDAFPLDPAEWLDTDGDGSGNNTDTDDDNDGVTDEQDAFPLDTAEWLDTDGDGSGNNADADDDNDGVNDSNDAFPLDPSRTALPTPPPPPPPPPQNNDSGGGSVSLLWLFLLFLLESRRRAQRIR